MRYTTFVPMLAAALIAVPAVGVAQQQGQTPRAQADARGVRPMGMLQRYEAELNVTPAQKAQLERIWSELRTRNEPLVAQLRAAGFVPGAQAQGERGQMTPEQREQRRAQMQERARGMSPEQREQARAQMQERARSMTPEQREKMRARMGERGGREIPEALRPVMQQIRQNNQAAMQQARAVLTPEQQARLRQLMRERGQQARRGARPAR